MDQREEFKNVRNVSKVRRVPGLYNLAIILL